MPKTLFQNVIFTLMMSFLTVSYTHLDVYKRQLHISTEEYGKRRSACNLCDSCDQFTLIRPCHYFFIAPDQLFVIRIICTDIP